ncbi:unannotated protein [freshwater metagenome]|uniref:Unannotated protein n=1 Tax=freshwater metagenome TaxID=449393 RepID=A0A6J6BAQ3_9ZZZZ
MSPTLPRGGPQTNRSKTFLASAGALSKSLIFSFAIEAGPKPAGSVPITSRNCVGKRIPSSDG